MFIPFHCPTGQAVIAAVIVTESDLRGSRWFSNSPIRTCDHETDTHLLLLVGGKYIMTVTVTMSGEFRKKLLHSWCRPCTAQSESYWYRIS
jgi:hypothetical protein